MEIRERDDLEPDELVVVDLPHGRIICVSSRATAQQREALAREGRAILCGQYEATG